MGESLLQNMAIRCALLAFRVQLNPAIMDVKGLIDFICCELIFVIADISINEVIYAAPLVVGG